LRRQEFVLFDAGRIADDHAVLHLPELGVSFPTAEVLAVEQGREALLGGLIRQCGGGESTTKEEETESSAMPMTARHGNSLRMKSKQPRTAGASPASSRWPNYNVVRAKDRRFRDSAHVA